MAVSATPYGPFVQGLLGSTAANKPDWVADTIKVLLLDNTYTPNRNAHQYRSDLTGEVTGTGYVSGGLALASKSITWDSVAHVAALLAATSQWAGATFSAYFAVIYKDTGNSSTSPLIGYVDFGGVQTVTTAAFSIAWDATLGAVKLG